MKKFFLFFILTLLNQLTLASPCKCKHGNHGFQIKQDNKTNSDIKSIKQN